MSLQNLSPEQIQALKDLLFLKHFNSADDMRHWCIIFLGINLPKGHIDPDSNSSPIEWMWEAYRTYMLNLGNEIPGFIVLSSRDSYKTLSESILAVILMLHFRVTIAHLAAIESQATKAIQYINGFLSKVKDQIEKSGLSMDNQSKRKIGFKDDFGNVSYVNVIIATLQGANSEHTNILTVDEIDVMRFPESYEEAKFIPGVVNGQFPLTIKTSTRKFAFGLMEKELQNAQKAKEKVLRWNILDITEKCPPSRHLPDEPKETRYIHHKLPLQNKSRSDMDTLPYETAKEFEEIEVHSGCAKCPLLPVCKMRLANRPDSDVGGLYKPIDFVINQFRKTSIEKAEAQLLCWKPTSAGLIYPRFLSDRTAGNIITVERAANELGLITPHPSLNDIIEHLHKIGTIFHAGVDWGFRHAFAITISCSVNDEWWLVDTYAVPGLEFDQMMALAKEVRDKYLPSRWYADTAQPMFIKEFNKNKMRCVEFKKDILGGIEAARTQVLDASNKRRLKIIEHDRNQFLIEGFQMHHFLLDSAGSPTKEPDDEEYADVMDTIRYQAQNLFGTKKKALGVGPEWMAIAKESVEEYNKKIAKQQSNWLGDEIRKATEINGESQGTQSSKSKGTVWDI